MSTFIPTTEHSKWDSAKKDCHCQACEYRRAYFNEWQNRTNKEVREEIAAYKVGRGCADCGYREHAEALDLDHVSGEKIGDISRMQGSVGQKKLWNEIAKCEVVCSNCHRVRTRIRKENA